jgi:hypothetical protein
MSVKRNKKKRDAATYLTYLVILLIIIEIYLVFNSIKSSQERSEILDLNKMVNKSLGSFIEKQSNSGQNQMVFAQMLANLDNVTKVKELAQLITFK